MMVKLCAAVSNIFAKHKLSDFATRSTYRLTVTGRRSSRRKGEPLSCWNRQEWARAAHEPVRLPSASMK